MTDSSQIMIDVDRPRAVNYADQFMVHPESLKLVYEKFTRINIEDKETKK